MSVSEDSALVAERFGDGLPEHDAGVLDGVVVVDRDVSVGAQVDVDHSVARDLLEHVLEEGDSGLQARGAGAVERDGCGNPGLARVALDGGGAVRHEGRVPLERVCHPHSIAIVAACMNR